jgi:ubiquinone/menaquinone biosynthesis C-methylase UbiE
VKPDHKRRLIESYDLLRAFKLEQKDPDSFYGLMAADAMKYLSRYLDFEGKLALDVGGGAGYFSHALAARGAKALVLEPDIKELSWRGETQKRAVVADGYKMPFGDCSFDLTLSSNVLEHVSDPKNFVREMIRVTKKGGIVFFCFTSWLSFWGGHETSPWHIFGGEFAKKRYEKKYKKEVKNKYLESLFPIYIGQSLKMVRSLNDVKILDLSPRYLPNWTKVLVYLPAVREIFTWNLSVTLQKL